MQRRVEEWLGGLNASGAFRTDVSLENLVAFINVVANGAALATSLGLPLHAGSVVKMIHTGIDAQ